MQKNITIIVMLLAAMVLVIPGVLAVTTISAPVTGTNYTTTLNIAVTVDANGANNMTNVTCYYNSSGGAATTYLTEILNDSVYDLSFTDAVDVSSFPDLTTYNISCAVRNGTTLNTTVSVAKVGIDNTAPTGTLVLYKADRADYKGTQRITWTSADATSGVSTVAVTMTSPNTDTCPTQSWSDESATDNVVTLNCAGTYTASMTITDTASNSYTTSDTFKVYVGGAKTSGDGEVGLGTFSIGGDGGAKISKTTIAIIAIIILIGWMVTKKK